VIELSEAAENAIQQAAAEAARAEALASLDRETAALAEARQWEGEYRAARKKGVKAAVVTGVICFFAGCALGTGTMLILQGR
jgi:hypothetical protein